MDATDLMLETLRRVAVAINGKEGDIGGREVRLVEGNEEVCVYGLLADHVDVTKLDRQPSDTALQRVAVEALQELKRRNLVYPNGSNGHSRDRDSIWVVMG